MECNHKPRKHETSWYCNARKKCGHPCDRRAGAGTDHFGIGACKNHLGNARTHHGPKLAKAKADKAEQDVRRYLRDQPVPVIDDPIRAMESMIADTQAFYTFVAGYVANLDVEEWTGKEGELSEYVRLLERAQARSQRFLADWVRLGLEERLVRLSERQAEAIGRVIDGVLNALGLDEATLAKARGELPRQLRLVSRGAA